METKPILKIDEWGMLTIEDHCPECRKHGYTIENVKIEETRDFQRRFDGDGVTLFLRDECDCPTYEETEEFGEIPNYDNVNLYKLAIGFHKGNLYLDLSRSSHIEFYEYKGIGVSKLKLRKAK